MTVHQTNALASLASVQRDVATGCEPDPRLLPELCAAFADALDQPDVRPDDDFFDLGGDSLIGETLALLLSEILGREFPISAFLEAATPRQIEGAYAPGAKASNLETSVPLFLVHGKAGYTFLRPTFRAGLAKGRKVVVFELPGLRDDQPTPWRIEGIAQHYVAQVLQDYPDGPIYLASYCTGGLIALEMASQLAAIGRPVQHLVLIDPVVSRESITRFEGKADKLLRRLVFAPLTGRLSGVTAAEDFDDDRLLNARIRFSVARRKFRSLRRNLMRPFKSKHARARAFDTNALSHLTTSYRHYWPKPFARRADVICSSNFAQRYARDGSIWDSLLPNCRFDVVLQAHQDIGSTLAAETMEKIFAGESSTPFVERDAADIGSASTL